MAGLRHPAASAAGDRIAEDVPVEDGSARELRVLQEAAELLASCRRLEDIRTAVVQSAARVLESSGLRWRVSFMELTGDALRRVAVRDEAGIHLGERDLPLGDYPVLRQVVETGETVVGDAQSLSAGIPAVTARLVDRSGLSCAVMIPVAHGGTVRGVLGLSTRDAVEADAVPMRSLSTIAHLGALAIGSAQIFAEQQGLLRQARELEQTKSNFLNLVAHEMRGPVTVVRGYASMLTDGTLDPASASTKGALVALRAKADEMNRLVGQMIETARLDSGRIALHLRSVDLRRVVHRAVDAMMSLIGGARPLSVVLGDRPLVIEADEDRVATIVMNLLDNAAKFSAPSAPVEVRCSSDGSSAAVSVVDHGIGLSQADMAVLFTRFGRVVNRETSHIPGGGLGLWYAREIARQHGGDIDVVSVPGAGSTFRVVLPLRIDGDRQAGAPPSADAVTVTRTAAPVELLVANVVDHAIFMLDPDGSVVTWNEGARRLKQYEAHEIIGRHFSAFYTPEDRSSGRPRRLLDEAVRHGRVEDEGWRVRKDGSRFWASVVITALRGVDGILLGFGKVTRDLTERRAAEQALRESQERFRLLVDSVVDYAIFMLDPHGNVATWNQGARRLDLYEPQEIIGQHVSALYTPEDRATGKPQQQLAEAVRAGRVEDVGWRVRKDGSRFWAEMVITTLRDPDGELRGFAMVTRDRTPGEG